VSSEDVPKFMGDYRGEFAISGGGAKHPGPHEEMVSSSGGGVHDRIAFEHVNVPRVRVGARGASQLICDAANTEHRLAVVRDWIGFRDFSQHCVPILLILKT
jgi:hypothetical protein